MVHPDFGVGDRSLRPNARHPTFEYPRHAFRRHRRRTFNRPVLKADRVNSGVWLPHQECGVNDLKSALEKLAFCGWFRPPISSILSPAQSRLHFSPHPRPATPTCAPAILILDDRESQNGILSTWSISSTFTLLVSAIGQLDV